jgi:hypothetical protein
VTGERRRRLVRVVAWLLTPLVVWAASFFGGWAGAAIGAGAGNARASLVWLVTGAVIGGVGGAVAWVLLLRRRTSATRGPAGAASQDGSG